MSEVPLELSDVAAYVGGMLDAAIRAHGLDDPRTKQSMAGIIGPSDLGFCRQKCALMTKGVPQSDAKSIWPAQVGTAVHRYVAEALRSYFEDWIVDDTRVTATFPSGFSLSGTPDVLGVLALSNDEFYLVLDGKTKDGLSLVTRKGVTLNNRYQRHTYALGAKQAGLNGDKPILVGNFFLDRSGRDDQVVVDLESFDDLLTREIDEWIGDVKYAVLYNEDASRDVAAPVCERICEWYTVCRGQLPTHDMEPIKDQEIVDALHAYVGAMELANLADRMKQDASAVLHGINGTDGKYQVRWTEVPETAKRAGYERIDVREWRG